jgi:hypothetical protein
MKYEVKDGIVYIEEIPSDEILKELIPTFVIITKGDQSKIRGDQSILESIRREWKNEPRKYKINKIFN